MGEVCLKRCALLAAGKTKEVLRDTSGRGWSIGASSRGWITGASSRGWTTGARKFGHHSDKKEEITLVEELKMRFRTKALGKDDLTRISIKDIHEIWVDTLVTQQGLSTDKIFLDPYIYKEMEVRLRDVFEEWSEDGTVDYEEYLPTMVDLIKANVSRTDQLEVANELFDVYFPNYSGMQPLHHGRVWQPKPKAMLQNLKIKSCYRVVPGKSNIEIVKNIEENESHSVHENGNVFSLWEFVMKMVNVPIIRGLGG